MGIFKYMQVLRGLFFDLLCIIFLLQIGSRGFTVYNDDENKLILFSSK